MAGKSGGKGTLLGVLLVLGLIGYACGKNNETSPPPSAAPLTVTSAETFADLTLSDGRHVHNTSVDFIASSVIPYSGASASTQSAMNCEVQVLDRYATDNLVGRPVSDVEPTSGTYSSVTPMAGYTPADVRFVNGSSTNYDVSSILSQVRSNAQTQCYTSAYSEPETTTPSPTTTSEAPANDNDTHVYVDAPDVHAPKHHTGHSGHPCLPGERDGDGDGYCGEGR